MEPIAHSTVRLVVADTTINGIDLEAGTMVEPMIAAANRDPAVFVDPDRLDPERQGPRVLSFGQGIHSCLGAAMARLELSEVVAASANRLDGWKIDVDPASLTWFPPSEPNRGLAHLPVAFR